MLRSWGNRGPAGFSHTANDDFASAAGMVNGRSDKKLRDLSRQGTYRSCQI